MSAAGPGLDCIVVGGGHNGLVCAAYLAKAGRSVLVLEAGEQLGGAAATREFAPGARVSSCAHLLHSLSRTVLSDLQLEKHGLQFAASNLPTIAVAEGVAISIGPDAVVPVCGSGCSAADQAAYPAYAALLRRFANSLRPVLESVPPRLGTDDWADRVDLLRMGWRLRRLGRHDVRELLRIGGMNVYDLLQERFESALLQGALGLDAVLGTNFGPRSPGSAFTLLYRMAAAGGSAGGGAIVQPRGGMGEVSNALGKAARAWGAQIRTGARVERILVREHRAAGVVLQSGETIEAATVISNADPKTTFLRLLGAAHLDTGFTRRISKLRTAGLAAKLHLSLKGLPRFTGLPENVLGGRLIIAPSLDYVERAFNHSKYGEYSAAPALEVTIPTVNDPGLAPAGQHVLSAIVQYAPYQLAGGWEAQRERCAAAALDTLERHAPGLKSQVLAAQLLAPPDLEAQFGMTGGHWHHAELALDQFFMMRPVPGAGHYATPLEGLYLCGAGCHPGGGVMGTAGRNAARRVLRRAA